MDDSVVYFTEDIVKEIMLRCPLKLLLRFKCVRKSWYALNKNPEFVQQQLKNHRSPQLLIYTNGTPDDPDHDYRSITLISEENPQSFKGMTHIIGYVDDLFLMYGTIDGSILCTLWNPATRKVRPLLLPLPAPIIHVAPVLGFGLDPLTNDYKVIYFHCYLWHEYAAAIYSCSRDSWRILKPKKLLPFYTDVRNTFGTAYLNGTYYWLLRGGRHCDYTILLFDFGSEMFEEIEGPDCNFVYTSVLGLMLMDDSIAILNHNRCSMLDYDIWVLIQPGVWNKIFTFDCIRLIKSCYDSSLIFADKAFHLVSYNVWTKKTRHLGFQHSSLGIGEKCGGCGVFYYKESLVKLTQQDD